MTVYYDLFDRADTPPNALGTDPNGLPWGDHLAEAPVRILGDQLDGGSGARATWALDSGDRDVFADVVAKPVVALLLRWLDDENWVQVIRDNTVIRVEQRESGFVQTLATLDPKVAIDRLFVRAQGPAISVWVNEPWSVVAVPSRGPDLSASCSLLAGLPTTKTGLVLFGAAGGGGVESFGSRTLRPLAPTNLKLGKGAGVPLVHTLTPPVASWTFNSVGAPQASYQFRVRQDAGAWTEFDPVVSAAASGAVGALGYDPLVETPSPWALLDLLGDGHELQVRTADTGDWSDWSASLAFEVTNTMVKVASGLTLTTKLARRSTRVGGVAVASWSRPNEV